MMKTITNHHKTCLTYRLLTASVMVAFILGLAMPGFASAEANPAGAPYIIVFKGAVDPVVEAPGLAKAFGLQAGFIYQHALKGMSAVVPPGRLVALQHDPRVAYVIIVSVRND